MTNIWLDLGAKTASVEVIITNPKEPKANLGNLGRASIADIDLDRGDDQIGPDGSHRDRRKRVRDAAGGNRGDAERRCSRNRSEAAKRSKPATRSVTFTFTAQTQ